MKVELTDLRLAMTAFNNVVVGVPAKDNQSFKHQQDVTNDFIKAVIERFGPNHRSTIRGNGAVYEITVKELK